MKHLWQYFRFLKRMHVIIILCCLAPPSFSTATEPNQEVSDNGVTIYHLRPDKSGGRAYRLVYHVKVPIEVYWKFKTDFDNAFLTPIVDTIVSGALRLTARCIVRYARSGNLFSISVKERIPSTCPDVDIEILRFGMAAPRWSDSISTARITDLKLSNGSPIPIKTIFL